MGVRDFNHLDKPLWDRIDIDSWSITSREPVGSDAGEWLVDPSGRRWLHKTVRVQTTHVDGEDWAEVATTAVAKRLRIPAASTRLSSRGGINGSLSLQVNDPDTHDFIEGALLLLDALDVDVHDERAPSGPKLVRVGHSLENIRDALNDVMPPAAFEGPADFSAFDVFAGYLCLDTLVANRDRHEQNWAVLEPRLTGGSLELAPSYDHGSALGYNLTPARRRALLADDEDLKRWAAKGTAHRLQHTKPPGPPTLLDAALSALRLARPVAQRYWSEVVCDFDVGSFAGELPLAIPQAHGAASSQVSDPVPTMIARLLEINQRRFCDAIANF